MRGKGRVLVDLERLRYPNSGIAHVAGALVKGLLKLNTVELNLYGPGSLLKKEFPKTRKIAWRVWDKYFGIRLSPYDIVQVSFQCSSYFHRVPKGCVKIVIVHDLNFLHENIAKEKRDRLIAKMRMCLRDADCVVCISNFVKAEFEEHSSLFNLPRLKRVTTIYNGIDFTQFSGRSLKGFSELNGKKYILNIGVIAEKKNQISLVRMLAFTPYDLVLVKSDQNKQYFQQLQEEIGRLNLKKRVHIYSNVSADEKQYLLENCVALCQPSTAEGFGIPAVEAMYFGKPVFLSTFTSLPEVGGALAYYFTDFSPGNMAAILLDGLKDYESRLELKEEIKQWATKFNNQHMAEEYNNLYQQLLSNS